MPGVEPAKHQSNGATLAPTLTLALTLTVTLTVTLTLTLTPTGGRAGRRAAPLVPALPRQHRRNPNPNQNPVRLTLIGRHGVAPNPNPQQVAEVLDAMEYAVYVHDVTHILLDNLQVCVCVCAYVRAGR